MRCSKVPTQPRIELVPWLTWSMSISIPFVVTLTCHVLRLTLANRISIPGTNALNNSKKCSRSFLLVSPSSVVTPSPGVERTSRLTSHCLRLATRPSVCPDRIGRTSPITGEREPAWVGPRSNSVEGPRNGETRARPSGRSSAVIPDCQG